MNLDQREYRASLTITSTSVTADTISNMLEVEPDLTWAMGDFITQSPGSGRRRVHGWKLRAPATELDDCESQTSELARILAPLVERLRGLPKSCELEIVVSAHTRLQRPSICVRPEAMRIFSAVGATLDCDIYDLTSISA